MSFSNPDEAPPRHSIAVHGEVAIFIPSQLKPPHERLRANIIGRSEAQDFRQLGSDEDIFQSRGCRFESQALAPGASHKAPPDLKSGCHRVMRRDRHNAGIADEIAVQIIDRPATEAMFSKRGQIAVQLVVALRPAERAAKVSHHLRVRMQSRKRRCVRLAPGPQAGSSGPQEDHRPPVYQHGHRDACPLKASGFTSTSSSPAPS
jgi:hypothetical protein